MLTDYLSIQHEVRRSHTIWYRIDIKCIADRIEIRHNKQCCQIVGIRIHTHLYFQHRAPASPTPLARAGYYHSARPNAYPASILGGSGGPICLGPAASMPGVRFSMDPYKRSIDFFSTF